MMALDGGRIGISAQATGVARSSLEKSVQYARDRKQFGKAIGEFQGIQWKLADMSTKLEARRLLCHRAASLKEANMPFSREASMSKLFCSEAAVEICNEAVQIHGGYGFRDAHALVATGAGDDGFFLVDSNAPSVLELSDDAPEVEAVRVARGLPRFGVDYNETHYPQEALLEKTHVAFDKGCYLGQEVVCMLELRGHVKRKLALVTVGSTAPAGTPVASLEGVPVGEVHGAATHACEAGKTLAFVMVKVAFAELGRELRVGDQLALVVAPPLAAVTP